MKFVNYQQIFPEYGVAGQFKLLYHCQHLAWGVQLVEYFQHELVYFDSMYVTEYLKMSWMSYLNLAFLKTVVKPYRVQIVEIAQVFPQNYVDELLL